MLYHAPIASNQVVSTSEDNSTAIQLSATDEQGRILIYSIISNPSHGILTGAPPTLIYEPTTDFNGSDSFTFAATDGVALSNVATVSINIGSVVDAPVASAVSLSVIEDNITAGNLIASDPEGRPLTFSIVANGSKGTATITNFATGTFSYFPNWNSFSLGDFKLHLGIDGFVIGDELIRRDFVDSMINDLADSCLVDAEKVREFYLG